MIELLDTTGSILAFTATIFYIRVNVFAWPISLIAISIDIFLYFKKGIYGDTSLNGIYFILTIYGWYQWKFGGRNKTELPILSLNKNLAIKLSIIGIIGISTAFLLLKNCTNSQVPVWDATTTVLSLIAQWMICRKIIQNWIIWFIVDSMYIGLYFYKGIPAHAILNIIYLSMAVIGYLKWKKQLNNISITVDAL